MFFKMNLISWSFFYIFLSHLLCTFTICGIIGGELARSFPFFVRVELNEPKRLCGGTIVAPDIVVTAAHCLYRFEERIWALKEDISVVKGDFSKLAWRRTAEWFSLENYITHDFYNPNLYYGINPFDIALIILRSKIDLSKSRNSKLKPCPRFKEYSEGLTIGMGLLFLDPKIKAGRLMQIKYSKDSECGKYKIYGIKIDRAVQVCYSNIYNRGICDGDGGSPIIAENIFTGRATCFIGIASFGASNCSDSRFPNVFTKAGYFSDWINYYIDHVSSSI